MRAAERRALASTVAAARLRGMLGQGRASADALTGGFHQALWVCGLIGLAAVPVALSLVRRPRAVPAAMRPEPAVATGVD